VCVLVEARRSLLEEKIAAFDAEVDQRAAAKGGSTNGKNGCGIVRTGVELVAPRAQHGWEGCK
jgi:hypothetical protein